MGMKNLGRGNFPLTVLSFFLAGILIIAGCSGGGGGATSSTGTSSSTTSTNPYSGAAKISGSIDVSGLSSSDQAVLSKRLPIRAAKAGQLHKVDYTTDAVAKLYIVGEDGSLTDTGITGTLSTDADGNPTYSFDGVKDGLNYVVRYLKMVGSGQVLELKGNVTVPNGATAQQGDGSISPKTTVVVETLISAILDATSGTGISQEIVNNIISAVKSAIQTLVDSGAIQIPSMVVEASGDTIDAIASTSTQNSSLDAASGVLLSNDSVGAELGVVKAQTQADKFNMADLTTDDAKRAFMTKVFKEMVDDSSGEGGVPTFMLNFFADKYIAGTTKTVGQIMDAVAAGLMFQGTPPDISKSATIKAFGDHLVRIYTLLDKKDAGTITDDEKKELSDIKPVFLGLFPIAERSTWSALSASTLLNVPQGIAMTVYITDVYIAQAFAGMQATYTASDAGGAGVSSEKQQPYDFNPMVPGSLMDMLGFYSVYQNYAGLDIDNLWIHPGRAWIESSPGNGHEVDMLSAGACISDVATMVHQFRPDLPVSGADLSSATVTLTYPKADHTTGTIALVSEASLMGDMGGPGGPGGNGDSCFIIDPWREATAGKDMSTVSGPIQPDVTRIISDFASGTYTITLSLGSDTVTKSFTKKVITGMTKAYATLVTPAGFPNWPGNGASQEEMDAFNQAMDAFNASGGSANFAANVDTDSDGVYDAAKIVVTWKAPTVTLPDGVKMGYQLDLGKGGCDMSGCSWEHIFSTWDHNKMLFTTSFTLPVNLPKQEQTDTRSYQLNVNVVFIDSTTGEMLGQGGNAHAEFRVADPLDKTKTFTITGTAVDGYKVVLFREVENPDSLTNRFTRTAIKEVDVTSGTYSLTPTIGDFLDYPKAMFNIVMYQDTDGSGSFSNGDMQIWPDWSAPHIFFNTWGGMLRVGKDVCTSSSTGTPSTCQHTETMIFGGETVDGPVFAAPSM